MSGLFGPKGQSTVEKRLNAIEVNQSAYGNPIALTYGKTRVPVTLGWYGAFTATPHTTKQAGGKGGGGGGSNTTFTYSAALVLILGEGQINGVGTIWADKAQTTLSALGLTLFDGAGGQAIWSYLTTNFSAQAIPYDHTAYLASGSFQLGNSAGLANLTAEKKGLQLYSAGTIDDAEPSAIITDYLSDPNHGASFSYLGTITGAGATTYQTYCIANGLFISPSEQTQRPARDFLKDVLTITNSDANWSPGVLNIVPRGDTSVTGNGRTYTPNLTPVYTFNDDDYLHADGEDPVTVTRRAPSERFNVIRVEYLDRNNQYNTAIAEAKDANDIALRGERVAPTLNLHSIVTTSVARFVAQVILQQNLFMVNSYSWKVRADYCLLEPTDYASLKDSVLGLSAKLVRMTETEDLEDDTLQFTAEEVLVGTAAAPAYNWQAAAGYAANYSASPGSVSTPLIFSAPPMLVDSSGGYEIWIAAMGAGALWGGCDVYMSLDNASYAFVGTISGPARYGTLTAPLATGTDPDTTHTLAIQLANTGLALVSGAAADVNNNRTLIYVDGEIMAYQTATLTGAGAYNLTTLRRGQYGSTPASHASGSSFARIDGAIFRVPYDVGMVGQTVYFKFCSFNVYGGGYESIGAVTAYSKVLASVNAGQLTPGPLTLVGRGVTIAGDKAFKSAATAAWDSDCYSLQGYLNGAFAAFRPVDVVANYMVGLNTDPTTDSSYSSLDYAFYCLSGALQAYESGSAAATFATYAAGDDLTISYDGAIVRYLQNGTVLREVMVGPGKKFYFDSSFNSAGATVQNIRFGPYGTAAPVLFNARGNCTVSDSNAQKVGGSSAYDSDVYSVKGYPSCHVSFKCNDAAHYIAVGLGIAPLSALDLSSINYAWHPFDTGALWIYEAGTSVGSFGTYDASTVLAITYDGTTVTYWKSGVSIRTVTDAGKNFYLDSSFYTPGGGVNSLRFGPTTNLAVADTAQIGANAVSDVYTATLGSQSLTNASAGIIVPVMSVPARPYATVIVVSAAVNVDIQNITAGALQYCYARVIDETEWNGGYPVLGASTDQVYKKNPASTNQESFSIALERTFSVAANTSKDFGLGILAGFVGAGSSCVVRSAKLNVKVRKR